MNMYDSFATHEDVSPNGSAPSALRVNETQASCFQLCTPFPKVKAVANSRVSRRDGAVHGLDRPGAAFAKKTAG